ncbi:MAG: hypothetical protein E7526_02450 [Ruminococcaceae bacterium]|nr:hypothetical protein [Oscillospiraceae bacterium]
MKNKQFAIVSVLLVLLLLLTACGTSEKTEYDLLEITEISGEPEQIFDKVLTTEEIQNLGAEQSKRADLLKNHKTELEIRERIFEKGDKFTDQECILGLIDGEICAVYVLHVDGSREQPDGTTITGCILKTVLVK